MSVSAVYRSRCCAQHRCRAVPRCETRGNTVVSRHYGRDGWLILQRSPDMSALVVAEATKAIDDHLAKVDTVQGLISMMLWHAGDRVMPLYIGKDENYGPGDRNLSASLAGIATNVSTFARWGYNDAYLVRYPSNFESFSCQYHW